VKDAADAFLGFLLAMDGDRPSDPAREQPGIIEAEEMVGMMVRERNGVDVPDLLSEELEPHLGRCVDEKVPLGEREEDAGPRPLIARIAGGANRTVATEHRYTSRRSRSEENQPALCVRGGLRQKVHPSQVMFDSIGREGWLDCRPIS
jgi:hypothetical protein